MKLSKSAPFLLCALLVLSALGWGVRSGLARGYAHSRPSLAYWLKVSGLSDIFHSGWFIVVLLALGVNLILWLFVAWDSAGVRGPLAASSTFLETKIPTSVAPALAAQQLRPWIQANLGTVQDCQGGFLVRTGRLQNLFPWVVHLSVLIILLGVSLSWLFGFQGRISAEEGSRIDYVELLQGNAPDAWIPFERGGRVVPGFFDPGFIFECLTSARPSAPLSRVGFYRGNKLVSTAETVSGAPVRFEGLTIHQTGFSRAAFQSANLILTDRKSGKEREFPRLREGQGLDLESFSFKVNQIRPQTELGGAAVRIQFQATGLGPEYFWIFLDHPDYDFAHRKNSPQNFTVTGVMNRYSTEYLIGRDPGLYVMWVGVVLLILSWFGILIFPVRRYEFTFDSSKDGPSLRVQGWSGSTFLFAPRFKWEIDQLEKRLKQGEVSRVST